MKLEQNSPWDTFEAIEPFINSDDKIVLDTRTLEYIKKIK